MCDFEVLKPIDFLPLYEDAFPLGCGRNLYYARTGQIRQIFTCDTVSRHSEVVYTCPDDALIVENKTLGLVFSVYTYGSVCCVEEILTRKKMTIPLAHNDEVVAEAAGDCGYLFLRITLDEDTTGEQASRVLLVDFWGKRVTQVESNTIASACKLPYIVKSGDSTLVIVEDSLVFPYENAELSSGGVTERRNSVLSVKVDELFVNGAPQALPFQTIMPRPDSPEKYIQILLIQENDLLILVGDTGKQNSLLLSVDFEGRSRGSMFCADKLFFDIVEAGDGSLHLVARKNENIMLYSICGYLEAVIDLNRFYMEHPDMECSKIVGAVDKKYVIFDAMDYRREDGLQKRVAFDIASGSFAVYDASLVELGSLIC